MSISIRDETNKQQQKHIILTLDIEKKPQSFSTHTQKSPVSLCVRKGFKNRPCHLARYQKLTQTFTQSLTLLPDWLFQSP